MNIYSLVILAAGLVVAGNAQAENGEALARTYNCMMCHAVATKSTGPSVKDIAAKYRADKGAQAMLEIKVRRGGAGAWGKIPMPATARSVSDEEIKAIVQWMLLLK